MWAYKEGPGMNKEQRKRLDAVQTAIEGIRETIDDAKTTIEELRDEEQEKFENLSEGLQQSEMGQRIEASSSALEEAVSQFDNFDIDELLGHLETAGE